MARALTLTDSLGKRWSGSSAAKYRVSESLSLCVERSSPPHTDNAPGVKRKPESATPSPDTRRPTSSNSRLFLSNLGISDGLLIASPSHGCPRSAFKRLATNTFPLTDSLDLTCCQETDDDDTDDRRVQVAKRRCPDEQYDADDESY
ncbi:hypothetical protein Bbelb_207190 [Branchiostoma belcheri]|nr:hypothetical protein Bbelb_207190 [Branchiostoma belcheri]